ncbi:MAG: relaxase/mobilization nuclease domain-containing protein [Oscillospiraceae bacterium]|nr:relaxase/mobilization nuclease domain-containing protein [Oscillospiraceae bacterium]
MFGNVNVDYKPCKSVKQLRRACNYILGRNPEQIAEGVVKTEQHLYYAFDSNRDNFADAVLLTRRLFGKSADGKSNLAYKMSISFHPDDNDRLSYEEAFRIAAEFARRFFYDKGYDVLFAVHTDREHIHAHFIIGNCHRESGKAFRRNERDLYEMSVFFGEQCMKRGLTHSVRETYYSENPCRQKETFAEVQMEKKGKETFKAELREAIEKECADPRNRTFADVMTSLWEHYHVETRVSGNTVSYRHPEYKNKSDALVSVRGSKLGAGYTKGGIEYVLEKLRDARTNGGILSADGGAVGKPVIARTGRGGSGAEGQGDQSPAHDRGEVWTDTASLFDEYRRRIERAERAADEAAERAKRVRRRRSRGGR